MVFRKLSVKAVVFVFQENALLMMVRKGGVRLVPFLPGVLPFLANVIQTLLDPPAFGVPYFVSSFLVRHMKNIGLCRLKRN